MEILDYDVYTSRMNKTLYDKCWWAFEIDKSINTVVDFGCADGGLFKYLNTLAPGKFKKFIGIDNNRAMRQRASKKSIDCGIDAVFIPSLKCIASVKDFNASRAVLVLNSVIHEILSYQGEAAFEEFLQTADKIGFKYIAIRDMHFNENYSLEPYEKELGRELWDKLNNIEDDGIAARWKEYKQTKLPKIIGHEYNARARLIREFLFKYSYVENWEREKQEIYFWPWLTTVVSVLKDNYYFDSFSEFSIPYQTEKIYNDLGIRCHFRSHLKGLLVRVGGKKK